MSERSAFAFFFLPMNCLLWQAVTHPLVWLPRALLGSLLWLSWPRHNRPHGHAAQDGGLRDAWRRKRAVVAVHARCGSRS